MYRAAIAAILSELNRQGRLTIVEAFDVEASKTSGLVSKLKDFELGRRPLIVTEEASEHLYLSARSEEHTSELQSLMRISYAVFCLKKKKITNTQHRYEQ